MKIKFNFFFVISNRNEIKSILGILRDAIPNIDLIYNNHKVFTRDNANRESKGLKFPLNQISFILTDEHSTIPQVMDIECNTRQPLEYDTINLCGRSFSVYKLKNIEYKNLIT